MDVSCPKCGREYSNLGIGHHWRQSNCNQPKLSGRQKDIVTGILMGDGCIERRESGSILTIGMINKKFLECLDSKFGILSTGVRKRSTAKESALSAVNSGFRPNAVEENYHDVYTLRTRVLSDIDEFQEWYSSGEKVFPEIKFNPLLVKMWYCCDGGLSISKNGKASLQIRCKNESSRIERLYKSFSNVGFEPTITNSRTRLAFSVDDTDELLNWMGNPAPGFEYKWKNESYDQYKQSKQKTFNYLEQI